MEDLNGEGPYNYNRHTIEMRRAHNDNPLTPSPWDDGLGEVMTGHLYFGFDSEEAFASWFGGWEAELNAGGYVLAEYEIDDWGVGNFFKGGRQVVFRKEVARKLGHRQMVEGPQRKPEHRYQRNYYDDHDDVRVVDWEIGQSDRIRAARMREAVMQQQALMYSKQLKGYGKLSMDGGLTFEELSPRGVGKTQLLDSRAYGKKPSIAQSVRDAYPRWNEQMKEVVGGDSWNGPDWIKRLAEEAPLLSKDDDSAVALMTERW